MLLWEIVTGEDITRFPSLALTKGTAPQVLLLVGVLLWFSLATEPMATQWWCPFVALLPPHALHFPCSLHRTASRPVPSLPWATMRRPPSDTFLSSALRHPRPSGPARFKSSSGSEALEQHE